MNNNDIPERDLDPPEPQEPIRIKSYWVTYQWEDGRTEELDWIDRRIEDVLDEIEYEYNRDILENQAQKWGEPDNDY